MKQTGPLSELTQEKAKQKGRQYGVPLEGNRSASCRRGKHTQCWMLSCCCACHNRALPTNKSHE